MNFNEFQGFRFGNVHSSDLHLEVVSNSNRYDGRMLTNPTDSVTDIPGADGQYYYGSTFKNKQIDIQVAFDNVREQDIRKIKQIFATDKMQDLVFDEEPYKTWKAKLATKPDFKFVCFIDSETNERVYKGEGSFSFICYTPYAYGFNKYIVSAADYYILNTPTYIIEEAIDDTNRFMGNNKTNIDYLPEDKRFIYNKGPQTNEDGTHIDFPSEIKYHYNSRPSDYEGGNSRDGSAKTERELEYQNRYLDNNLYYDPNDKIRWKGGFPTQKQVENGELYFDTEDGQKSIFDVKGYWKNIPRWQNTAKLLTTPTLDFDQELMYMPQYSKTDYINMEFGFDSSRAMIGARMLVYNPGDVPIDWEMQIDENKRSFWSSRGGARFRISRYNVQRLPIPNAVDWCGLTTESIIDNEDYKYGNKYFKRRVLEISRSKGSSFISEMLRKIENSPIYKKDGKSIYSKDEIISLLESGKMVADKHWDDKIYPYREDVYQGMNHSTITKESGFRSFNLHLDDYNLADYSKLEELKQAHPTHCYYAEPIPREKLGKYIRIFYQQTVGLRGEEVVPNGKWRNTRGWEKFVPESIYGQNKSKYRSWDREIQDIDNPLVSFINMFVGVAYSSQLVKNSEDSNETTTKNGYVIWSDQTRNTYRNIYKKLRLEEGLQMADEYEELYASCADENAQYKLYWSTLKKLLSKFAPMIDFSGIKGGLDEFIDLFINTPPEFIIENEIAESAGAIMFNGYRMPQWITEDYIEIDHSDFSHIELVREYLNAMNENTEELFNGHYLCYDKTARQSLVDKKIYTRLIEKMDKMVGLGGSVSALLDDYYKIDSKKQLLYTTNNEYGISLLATDEKSIENRSIYKANWFKLPPGWSLITVEPIMQESVYEDKTWNDSRPFDWGYGGDIDGHKREVQQLYEAVFKKAKEEFFSRYYRKTNEAYNAKIPYIYNNIVNPNQVKVENNQIVDEDSLIKFKTWYADEIDAFTPPSRANYSDTDAAPDLFKKKMNYFRYEYYLRLRNKGEYCFLKIINNIWQSVAKYYTWTAGNGIHYRESTYKNIKAQTNCVVLSPDDYDTENRPLRCINGLIDDWWWYACNYLWANFPPIYWSMADLATKMKIEYVPQYL